MNPYRSMLFVPGHKSSWADKAIASGVDALILDLEDSVPAADKTGARDTVRDTLGRLRRDQVRADVWVRPNSMDSGLFGADVGRELGFEFTPEGLETLYLRSRIILAARAAGLHHPVTGVWQDIKDLDGFRRFALDARGLGYRGMVCIHPSHVAVSNEVFTPSPEAVDHARRMIEAFRKAEAEGSGAVDFEGQHIDLAHAKTAEGIVALADAIAAR